MRNLTARWPLGLCDKNCADFTVRLGFVLFILVFFDVFVSYTLQELPAMWRAPFEFVTGFGLAEWALIPCLVALVLSFGGSFLAPAGLWRRASVQLLQLSSFIFLAIGATGLLTNLLKRLIGRARPLEFAHTGVFNFHAVFNEWNFQSFPSGHTTTAMATAFVVGFVAPRFFKLTLLIALTTGISRVVIGMHYPTDIIAGFVIGTLGAYLVRNIYAHHDVLFFENADGTIIFKGVPDLALACRQALSALWRIAPARRTDRP